MALHEEVYVIILGGPIFTEYTILGNKVFSHSGTRVGPIGLVSTGRSGSPFRRA